MLIKCKPSLDMQGLALYVLTLDVLTPCQQGCAAEMVHCLCVALSPNLCLHEAHLCTACLRCIKVNTYLVMLHCGGHKQHPCILVLPLQQAVFSQGERPDLLMFCSSWPPRSAEHGTGLGALLGGMSLQRYSPTELTTHYLSCSVWAGRRASSLRTWTACITKQGPGIS